MILICMCFYYVFIFIKNFINKYDCKIDVCVLLYINRIFNKKCYLKIGLLVSSKRGLVVI